MVVEEDTIPETKGEGLTARVASVIELLEKSLSNGEAPTDKLASETLEVEKVADIATVVRIPSVIEELTSPELRDISVDRLAVVCEEDTGFASKTALVTNAAKVEEVEDALAVMFVESVPKSLTTNSPTTPKLGIFYLPYSSN